MAKTIVVAHSKGGPGKTTVATNLAVAAALDGVKVLLVDADVQASSMAFRALRPAADIAAIAITTPTLHEDLPALSAGYDLVIVDVGGRDSKVFRSAIMAGDLVIIPCLASQVDLFAASDVVDVVKEAKIFKPGLRALWVLNQIVPGTKLGKEIKEAITEYQDTVDLLDAILHARMVYRTCYGEGRGVLEGKDAKAAQEVTELYKEIKSIMRG